MDCSSLQRLPTELRVEIYRLVIVRKNGVFIASPRDKMRIMDKERNILALTETCKLLRTESLPELYGRNKFDYLNAVWAPKVRLNIPHVQLPSAGAGILRAWLHSIGKENSKSIRSLTFDLGSFSNRVQDQRVQER